MLKIYDQNKNPAGYISKYKDACVESDLETGDKSLSFTYCARKSKNIQNEYYIETKDDRYVVKETGISSDGFPEYQCKLDLEDLESYMHSRFASENSSLLDAARLAVAGTGWKVKSEIAADKIRKVAALKATPYTILGKIRDAWMCEMSFDTKNKTVCFSEKIGNDKGVYFVSGLNLNKIKYTEDTYDFYTRIVPIGKDGLKITDINSGKEYVENYQYSSKVRTLIWEDTNYEDAAAMKEDAIAKLADLSKPKKSYSVEVFDLAKQNQKYSLLEYALGDTILLLDEKTGTREKQRIVKMKEYPQTPEKNTCELSNTVLSWEEYQSKLEAARSAFENITNADGTVKGILVRGVEANGVVGIETVINNSASVKDMQSQIITVKGDVSSLGSSVNDLTGEVSLVKARIGTVEATYIKANEADIKYATLEKANILQAKVESIDGDYANFKSTVTDELSAYTAKIDNLNGDYAEFKEATITDLSAVNARIDTVNANNITAENLEAKVAELGYLSAEKAEIIYLKTDELESKVGTFGYLRSDEAKLKYADIGLANVNNAWIENGIIKEGSIGSGAIHDGAITNAKIADATIEAAKIKTINADNIIAGTIKTDRLIITGKDGEESIVEVINRANGVSEAEINNTKIQAASIDVADLSAFQAQIAGFDMSNYAIYSGKTSIKDPTSGIYISTVGIGMGDGSLTGKNESPLQAYVDGSFKLIGKNSKFDFNTVSGTLDMEVSSLKIASKSVATSDDLDDVLSEKTTVIEIESSNGAPLKDGVTTTALSVIIYNGQNRITTSEELHKVMSSDVHLKWYYKTNDESNHIDIPANDSRISDDGFKLVPTADDIANRVSFKCRLVSTGSGYITPDRETAIDRVASRLQDYVDETILPSVKNDITSEINKDVYVSQIEQNKDNIAKLQDEVANSDIRRGKQRQVGKACLWYHDFYHFGNTDEEAAAVIAQNDIVVAGGTLYSGKFSDADRDRQIAIIQKAKKLNPKLKIFYYITIASWRKDGDWSHILGKGGYWDEEEASKHPGAVRIHTKWEIYQLLEYACHVGGIKNGKKEFIEAYTWTDDEGTEHTEDKYIDLYEGGIALDGCFYDDAGMETEEGRINQGFPVVLREKYIQLVDYTHSKGLIAFPNQMSQDWYADTVSSANPDGLPSAIGENDYMLLESCHSQVGFSGRPLWRHVNNTTNVWNYYQNWYPKVGSKVVVNDYLYGSGTGEKLSDEEFYELATYLVCDTLCCGAHYIDMNGLRTWDLPEFFDDLLISDDTEYDITREAAGHYILHANGHTLEVIRGDNLAQGETVSLKTLNKVYIYFDGIRIKNGFKKVPQYVYETDQRLGTVEDELEKLQTSSKSTASIYHRMMIDDWTSEYIYTNFVTTTEFIKGIVDKVKTGIATVDSVDYGTNNLKLTRLTNSQIVQFLTVDISNKKGHTLEFGWTVNEVTKSNNWGFNTESPAVIGWTTIRPAMNNTQKSSLYGENFYGYVKTVIIPEDTEEDTWRLRIVYNGAAGEVFDFSNFYAIDVDEYGEDITKDWYTNLIPTLVGATNNNLTVCYKLEKFGDYDFTITWNDPNNYANWSGLRWNIPNGSFIPGHTYEFGCETYEHNAGGANVAFRLYYPGANKWIPATLKIKSTIYGDERPGFIFTVPESETATDGYINFTNTSGKYQNSAGDYIQATIKGMYLYDVNEENIVIRGEEPSNSYMQICRVSKEKLEKDKKLIGNAVYIVDDGTMFATDFNGKRIDISISGGSGITIDELRLLPVPTAEDEGRIIKVVDGKWQFAEEREPDIASIIKERLRLGSDDSYIYLKYDSEEISKIPFKGTTLDPDPEPDPTVTVHIGKGASWAMSGTDPKLGGNTARAYSYVTDTEPNTGIVDSVHKYGILLENGQTYMIKLDSSVAPGCYYGLNVYSASGRVLDSGWKAAGTDYTYTPASDELYLYVNFKSGSAGSATITDEILETMINGFSITKEAVS